MNDFYFEINPSENKIVNFPVELDINWKNISGILFLSKEELYDLTWAGYPNVGFVKISKENNEIIKNLSYDPSILNSVKLICRNIVTKNCSDYETSPILIDNSFSIQLTEKNKLQILMKYNECISNRDLKFNWKTLSGFVEFDSEKFINLYNKLQSYIQKLLDIEYNLYMEIEKCNNMIELLDLDFTINFSCEINL